MTEARTRWTWRWLLWLGALGAATVGMHAVRQHLDKAHVALVYLLVVLGASADVGRTLGLTVATAAFVLFNALFLPPFYTLAVANPLDLLVLLAFLVTSIVAAQLLERARVTAAAATARALEVDRLATLGAETLSAAGAGQALHAAAEVVRGALAADVCEVYVRDADGRLMRAAHAGEASDASDASGDVELSWERLPASVAGGRRSAVELADGTVYLVEPRLDSIPPLAPHAVLLPLVVRDHPVGVLRVASTKGMPLSSERARLLVALAYYTALGVERVRLEATAERAEAERRVEALRSALLMAVSHDLRTPLTTIKGIAHEVAHGAPPERATVIEAEADRLDTLVGDLLDLSRIQAGAVRPDIAVNTADELVGAALQRAAGALRGREARVDLPDGALLAGRFDFSQTLRVLVNLLENAAKYAPPHSAIDVRARREGERLTIAVLDRGPGVQAAERERIFEPFYRPPGTPPDVRGTGLGLSIARGLAEAQGGSLRHDPRDGGGSAFTLDLPGADVPDDGD